MGRFYFEKCTIKSVEPNPYGDGATFFDMVVEEEANNRVTMSEVGLGKDIVEMAKKLVGRKVRIDGFINSTAKKTGSGYYTNLKAYNICMYLEGATPKPAPPPPAPQAMPDFTEVPF